MAADDAFCDLAPYYDRIMDHVNYDRWYLVTTTLAALLPRGFLHLDAACGTGTLLKRLQAIGWNSFGVDLSLAMLRAGKKTHAPLPVAAADLRALPLAHRIDYVTCLFDSVNFLLDTASLIRSFAEIAGALTAQGLFYFDVVTERMVTEHFEGQEWTENNGRFSTTWRSSYCRKTGIAETHVRVNSGIAGTVRERVYTQQEIEHALREAGLYALGAFDAHSWKAPGQRTVRIDFVAAKSLSRSSRRAFESVCAQVRRQLA
jgi:SAM-dependent methyltransferase